MLRTQLALALAFPLVVIAVAQGGGCGGSGSSGGNKDACDEYFDGYLHCVSPADAPAALEHFRTRFELLCERLIALPGSSFDADQASDCGKALQGLDCGGALSAPACQVKPGDLADGAVCASSAQCKSAVCLVTFTASTDGGTSSSCGVCTPAIAEGQPCGSPNMLACTQGTSCDGTSPNQICTRITYGAAGASCGTSAKRCNGGLYCDYATKLCTQEKAAGAACGSSEECGSGLTCDKTAMICAKATIVPAGQPCGGAVECEVGSCPATGTCPTILADGQPCDSSDPSTTCDVFAGCSQGICKTYLSDVCK